MLQKVLDAFFNSSAEEQQAFTGFLGKNQTQWLAEPITERLTMEKYRLRRE